MKRSVVVIAVLFLALCSATCAVAEVYVICNNGTSLIADEIVDVFLGGKQFSGGVRLVPADNATAHEEFLDKVLRMSRTKYSNFWIKKSFRDGSHQPSLKTDDREILQFVRQTPGGVGYVKSTPTGVKIIGKY